MKWRAEPGAFRAPPYTVFMSGAKWIARKSRMGEFPEHLGTYDTHRQAMEACAEHADEMANEGWATK